jgi:hypothetical protein
MSQESIRVVLMAGPKPVFDYATTVLGKPFVQLERTDSMRHAFDAICRDLPRLLVVEQSLKDGPATHLLERLASGLQTRRPQVLFLGSMPTDAAFSLPLQPRLLRVPTPIDRFDSVVMEMLGYKPRGSRRHMVRLTFKGDSSAAGTLIGTTISISSAGMLIESKKKLGNGLRLKLELMGLPELKGLEFPAVVLRSEETPAGLPSTSFYYAVSFEDVDPFNIQQLIAYISDQDAV